MYAQVDNYAYATLYHGGTAHVMRRRGCIMQVVGSTIHSAVLCTHSAACLLLYHERKGLYCAFTQLLSVHAQGLLS